VADTPSILDVAGALSRVPGYDGPTPRWGATLAYLYGLPLSEHDLDLLAASTHRSRVAIGAHARRTLGRRRFRRFWARIGRRGRKSAVAALIAIYEAHWGWHERFILPGEQALVAVISKDLAGAAVVTRFVRLYLDALGIRYSTTRIGAVQIIEIEGCQVGIATLASTSEAPRGHALPVIILDEYAHHPEGDEYAGTATALLEAAVPAQMQFPDSLLVGISTPLGKVGRFHEEVELSLGNDSDERSLAVEGASWDWGTVTEATVRAELTDPRLLAREGLAQPQVAALAAFPSDDVDRAFLARVPAFEPAAKVLLLDPSSGGLSTRDRFTWAIASYCVDESGKWARHADGMFIRGPHDRDRFELPDWRPLGPPYLALHEVGAFEGGFSGSLTGDQIADELARISRRHGVRHAHSDQRESLFLTAALSRRSITLHCHTWTSPSKAQAVTLVRRWLADGALSLPASATELKRELLAFEEVITPSGALTFGARRSGHDDHVALLLTLAHAELNPDTRLPRSNLGQQFRYARL
jgi:hypothetical protein